MQPLTERGGERQTECEKVSVGGQGRQTGNKRQKRERRDKKHESVREREGGREREREEKKRERSMKACFWWDSKSQHLFGWGSEKSSVSPCSARGNAIPGCMGFYEKQLYVEKGRWREPEKERQQGKEGEQE